MEADCMITVILPINITGSKGFILSFRPYRQYCYEEELIIEVPCEKTCNLKKIKAWRVKAIDQEFIINANNAMPSDFLRDEDEQLSYEERARKYLLVDNHAKDHKKKTLEVIGHDIKAAEKTDFNGEWLQKILDERDNANISREADIETGQDS